MKPVLRTAFLLVFAFSRLDQSAAEAASGRRIGIDTSFGERFHEAGVAINKKQYQETVAKATAALEMKPDGKNAAILYRWRGVAYESLGDLTRALADYTEAIRNDPGVDHVHGYRGALYAQRGELSNAIADFTSAIRTESLKAEIYGLRAIAYAKMGRRDSARSDYEQSIRLPAKNGPEYAFRASSYFRIGQYKAAASDYAAAKRLDPSDMYILNSAAWFEATCPEAAFRDGKAAVRDATHACEQGKWKNSAIIDTLAGAYAETGDFDRAIKYETQAIGLPEAVQVDRDEQRREHLRLFQEHKPVREKPKV